VDSLVVAVIVFACTFSGAILGILLHRFLPQSHLSDHSKDGLKLALGLIGTMSALVLGLLIASAKSSFDAQRTGFQQIGTQIVLLDDTLRHYGPDAKPAREILRQVTADGTDRLWPPDGSKPVGLNSHQFTMNSGLVYAAIRDLAPKNDAQREVKSQAIQVSADLSRARWLLNESLDSSIPPAFLVVVIFWLFVLFTGFGLLSPGNSTILITLLVCAISVAGALLLIVDLDQPFDGLIQISSTPLRNALSQIGK
jgi:hypothetical protein